MPHPHAAGTQRHVLCMKWGTKYGPDYVNRLYAMVRRHLSGDFNFVCLTDDGRGIRAEVQCLPIPPLCSSTSTSWWSAHSTPSSNSRANS